MFWRFLLFWLRPRQQPPQTVITVSLFESLKLPLIGLRPNSTQIWAQLSLMLWHLLKNFFRFRGVGNIWFIAVLFSWTRFWSIWPLLWMELIQLKIMPGNLPRLQPITSNAPGLYRNLFQKNLCFKTVIREIIMKANTVGGRERGCILRLKVMSGHSTWFIISPNSAGTYRIFLFDHMSAKFDTSLWDSLFSFSCPSLTFSLVLGVSCVRF